LIFAYIFLGVVYTQTISHNITRMLYGYFLGFKLEFRENYVYGIYGEGSYTINVVC